MDRSNQTPAGLIATCLLLGSLCVGATYAQNDGQPVINEEDELPQGLTIVPWKKTASGELEEGPVRLVDEPLKAIEPEAFRRQLQHHSSTTQQN